MLGRATGILSAGLIGCLATLVGAAETIGAGQEVKVTIGPRESRAFEVNAAPGQYLRFTLDTSRTHLLAKLLRADGESAVVLTDTGQHESPVSLSLIATEGGVHRLTLQSAAQAQ